MVALLDRLGRNPTEELPERQVIELLFLPNSCARADIDNVEVEAKVETNEIVPIRREAVLPAIAAHHEFANLDRFSLGDAPFFKPEILSTKDDGLAVWRKRRIIGIGSRNLERDLQRFALNNCNREVVLRQKIFPVRAESKICDVASEFRRQLFFPKQTRNLFVVPGFTE